MDQTNRLWIAYLLWAERRSFMWEPKNVREPLAEGWTCSCMNYFTEEDMRELRLVRMHQRDIYHIAAVVGVQGTLLSQLISIFNHNLIAYMEMRPMIDVLVTFLVCSEGRMPTNDEIYNLVSGYRALQPPFGSSC